MFPDELKVFCKCFRDVSVFDEDGLRVVFPEDNCDFVFIDVNCDWRYGIEGD